MDNLWMLFAAAGVMVAVIGGLVLLGDHYTLNNIKSKTVGDGQHGTARWATDAEIRKTYALVLFQVSDWRAGRNLPDTQGLVLGSISGKHGITALVDKDDVHCLMIGASGVGKTAYFLYPNLEYACACGMSFLALDTKGDHRVALYQPSRLRQEILQRLSHHYGGQATTSHRPSGQQVQ